jgi:diguanylate cyclase (GGDEF)-like protein
MNWRGLFFTGLIWSISTLLPAQAQELGAPIITNYEPDQYKAHYQNWVAVQDRRGMMYFGNANGILEFDGQRWQLIPTQGNATIRSLACGTDGTIYYGSIGDFGFLAVSPSGKVAAFSLQESIPQADRTFNDVWQVLSSRNGTYFLLREKIFHLENGQVHTIQGKLASSQACLLSETVFYADMDKGLCMLEGDQAVPVPQLAGVYNGKRITLAPFGRHELLVGRVTGDFLRIDLSAFWDETSQHYDVSRQAPLDIVKAFPCELDDFIKESNSYLYKLIPIGIDTFAISTIKGGIITFDGAGKIIRVINTNSNLLDNTVTNLFLDRTHNLWACTNTGISHIELSVPQSYFGIRNNIPGIIISSQFHDDRMYIGSFENMLVQTPYRFALQDDKQVFRTLKNSPTQVWQFLEVDGDLMAATAQGLFQVQGEEAIKVQGSSANAVSLARSKRWPNHLFVGLLGGMDVFRRKAGPGLNGETHWEFLGKVNDVKDNIRGLCEDINGDLWAGTEAKGLLQIHFSSPGPTQVVLRQFGPEHGLPGLSGLRTVTRGNTLFVLSPKGLFRATIPLGALQAPEAIRFTPDTTLGKSFINPPVALNDMIFDQEGGVFFITTEGIVWAIPGENGEYRIEKRPFCGIPAASNTMLIHPNGSIWLPGKGLYRVDYKSPKDYDQPFNVLVRKVIAKSGRVVFAGTDGHPGSAFAAQRTVFASGQNPLEIPELPFRENALSFEFAAAFFEKPGTTQFQYLLEGFDKEWCEWSGKADKEYTNLPEGKYRFRVHAKNIYGTLGHEAMYSLLILPPWYRMWWAYGLWIIIGLATLFGIVYLYTLRLRRQKAHLEDIVAERTQQLRDASLTDPLTGLRNRRFILEVLQNDISAFIGFKNYILNTKNQRRLDGENIVFGLLIMDIDFFKKVNDTYGHEAGDRVLKQFAKILTDSVRQDDVVMRMGGEEFLVVLKKTNPEYLHVFAAKILKKVAATPFDVGGGTTIHKTCSIGYVRFPVYKKQPDLLTFEQSTMIADLGLFYAKNHGRNQGICIESGLRMPSGEAIIQKTLTSLEFALQESYLQIDNVIEEENI